VLFGHFSQLQSKQRRLSVYECRGDELTKLPCLTFHNATFSKAEDTIDFPSEVKRMLELLVITPNDLENSYRK
jgi:hypothetical protein